MEPLTDAQLDALAQKAEQATPGPWTLDHDDEFVSAPPPVPPYQSDYLDWIVERMTDEDWDRQTDAAKAQHRANCRYLAACSPEVVRSLVAEVKALRKAHGRTISNFSHDDVTDFSGVFYPDEEPSSEVPK